MMLNKKNLIYFFSIFLVILIGTIITVKKISPLSYFWWGKVNVENNTAAHGQDVVAYFLGKSLKGNNKFSVTYDDILYLFSTAENANKFSLSPNKFVPQFGGYCAFATSKGFTADVSINAWTVVENKLYFFADTDMQKEWLNGIAHGSLKLSHVNWNKVQLPDGTE